MFCPVCRDEFRPGFTRCGRCDVDLVASLSERPPERAPRPEGPPPDEPLRLADYCGFLSLEEALEARMRLRRERIRTEVVLREPADADLDRPPQDEYWLRVDISRLREIRTLVDPPAEVAPGDEEFGCSECGAMVRADADSCPGCGVRFDD